MINTIAYGWHEDYSRIRGELVKIKENEQIIISLLPLLHEIFLPWVEKAVTKADGYSWMEKLGEQLNDIETKFHDNIRIIKEGLSVYIQSPEFIIFDCDRIYKQIGFVNNNKFEMNSTFVPADYGYIPNFPESVDYYINYIKEGEAKACALSDEFNAQKYFQLINYKIILKGNPVANSI